MRRTLLAGLGLLALGGCTSTGTNVEGDWQCPMPGGAQCAPIEKVDPYVNGGGPAAKASPDGDALPAPALTPGKAGPAPGVARAAPMRLGPTRAGGDPVPVAVQPLPPAVGTAISTEPMRTGEQIAKVWVFPFVDKAGTYHEGEYVDVVVRPSTWIAE